MLPLPTATTQAVVEADLDMKRINVEVMLYAYANASASAPLMLVHTSLLEPTDDSYGFFGWQFLYDWIVGLREVIAFVGDGGAITLVSETEAPLSQQTQAWQVTADIAQYLRTGVTYVTAVMIAVAAITVVYMVACKGHYEGLNMFELSRVGAITWVGRPMLLLRSMTALCVLSTATLELKYSGYISYLSAVATPWYKTLLAANEVTWLVSIVNDVSLVLTQEYTAFYVYPNSELVWVVVAALSAFSPVTAEMDVDMGCNIVEIDFQVVCTSGGVHIGHLTRMTLLIVIVVLCNLLCFLVARHLIGRKPSCPVASLFLSSGARYLYNHQHRRHNGVYYLDPASAALNGILTMRYGKKMLVLDLKIWRTFVLDVPAIDHKSTESFLGAFPLLD
ncbi:hypothetical protein ACHHYP_06215 [Achlya hypogyna]|uniref:Transmembrane protein n=1 Tax=Achlya hypogyna TaxID=1202772 RepID=A0A1V9YV06_ACHHY|nr:hypothetical protein ACHHYP_06215 [Achlya hypogyna]